MISKIQKWGNSQGLRLARPLLADAELEVGDEVEIEVQEGRIIITPARTNRGRHNLEALVAKIPKNYRVEEIDWGAAVGREAW